jgi:hypothetical protein
MRRTVAIYICRSIHVAGTTLGLVFGAPDLVWPYLTVSDLLASSGGTIVYVAWFAQWGVWVCTHGSSRDAYVRCGIVAATLVPVLPCPRGTPIRLEDVSTAPLAYAAHALIGIFYVAVMLVSIDSAARNAAASLCVAFVILYIGGQLVSCEWAVALGSLAEWTLLHIPLFVI